MQASDASRRESAVPCFFNSLRANSAASELVRRCASGAGHQRFQLTTKMYQERMQSLRISGIGRLAKMHFRRVYTRIVRERSSDHCFPAEPAHASQAMCRSNIASANFETLTP